jgi:CubicO group peptidase (beta-lactamase class C family)
MSKPRKLSPPFVFWAVFCAVWTLLLVFLWIDGDNLFRTLVGPVLPNDASILQTDGAFLAKVPAIETLIREKMVEGKIPGLSVAIVRGSETIYQAGFGFADLASRQKATAASVYQIGSNSKAFTALGILKLEKDGRIDLDAPVTRYIPWLKTYERGVEVPITVVQFLHHTSGLDSNTIYRLSPSEGPDALTQTVRKLSGIELVTPPGQAYQYATMNYDVLGLLIETVTGQSYDEYIEENVLKPLGLDHTYVDRSRVNPGQKTQGYKTGFTASLAYSAPWYEGDKPAGYLLSDVADMAQWLKIQTGAVPLSEGDARQDDAALIRESHVPDQSVPFFGEGMVYAEGWIVTDRAGTEILHRGSNPNYSSYLIFRPEEQIGVAVLSNSNSYRSLMIGQGILDILLGRASTVPDVSDLNTLLDRAGMAGIGIMTVVMGLSLLAFSRRLAQLRAGAIHLSLRKNTIRRAAGLTLASAAAFAAVTILPSCLLDGITWDYIFVWYPVTLKIEVYFLYTGLSLFFLSALFWSLTAKNEGPVAGRS